MLALCGSLPEDVTPEDLSAHLVSRGIASVDDAYLICLGRPVDEAALQHGVRDRAVADVISELFASDEFRRHSVARLLRDRVDLKRGVFAHIPKTAGTSVNAALATHQGWLVIDAMRLESRDELDVVDLVRSLAGFAAALESGVSQVWLTGHLGLQGWRDRGLLRADDTCFTVLRQPLELFVSFANYVVAQVATVPLEPQSLRWAGWLAEAEIKSGSSRADMAKALLLKSSGLVEEMANPMTTYLSSEHERSAVRAYEHALAWNCDMVTMVELADYIHKLGVEDDLPRLNESQPGSLRVEELSPVERARIADRLLEEDLILWGLATS